MHLVVGVHPAKAAVLAGEPDRSPKIFTDGADCRVRQVIPAIDDLIIFTVIANGPRRFGANPQPAQTVGKYNTSACPRKAAEYICLQWHEGNPIKTNHSLGSAQPQIAIGRLGNGGNCVPG